MRRLVQIACACALLASIGVACIPATPPPPGYLRPVVDSVTTPDPTAPGTDVTIVLSAHDDEVISGLTFTKLRVGDGRTFPTAIPCTSERAPGDDPQVATFAITCAIPSFANNGIWDLTVTVNDKGSGPYVYKGLVVHLPIRVVGGTDDTRPAHLESFSTDPTIVTTGTAFTLTTRFSDPAGTRAASSQYIPLYRGTSTTFTVSCSLIDTIPAGAGLTDLVWSCPALVDAGTYRGTINTIDGLGHQGQSTFSGLDVGAA